VRSVIATWGLVETESRSKSAASGAEEPEADESLARERVARLEFLTRVSLRLAKERNRQRFLEAVLDEAQSLCHADGGTLYLRTDSDELAFVLVQNTSLGIRLGREGTQDKIRFDPIPLFGPDGTPNLANVASAAVHQRSRVHVADAYSEPGFDFTGTRTFDAQTGYRSQSFLTIPLVAGDGRVIGVLQLLNAQDATTGAVVPFNPLDLDAVEALAAQAALALESRLLLEDQKELLESFIRLIAAAIDSKSPYTGGHCERVPVLTEMLVRAAADQQQGPFANFELNDEEWFELRIAAGLHDCGKVTTPVHIMDKASKLEGIVDGILAVRHRFEIMARDEKIAMLEALLHGEDREVAEARYAEAVRELNDDLAFLERANIGGEFLAPVDQERIRHIAKRTFEEKGVTRSCLDGSELERLLVQRGTLTPDERLVINGHMVETVRMLEALPFPKNLARVPEYAGAHHERMDGKGYPRGLFLGDLSLPARAMAIADVFEALTADDRPYKRAKKLSEAMRIMGQMKKDAHLDPELFDLFVSSGTYRKYAERFLDPALIDAVDEAALLRIEPYPYELPPLEERNRRRTRFLPEYEERFPRSLRTLPRM
jgi:HD-GYP domain-containing protein (c-di-GMP phosphodiesterase class II)